MYDVIVVGLGPGGATASYYASINGARVLGIDRRREIGVPIQCGEFMPQPHTYREILPDARRIEFLTKIPERIIRNRIRRVSIFSPSGVEYRADFDGYVINRAEYDKWIVSNAVKAGADIMIEGNVYSITYEGGRYRVKVSTPRGRVEVESKVLIIAAGASTKLSEMVGLDREVDEHNLAYVIQEVMVNVDHEMDKIDMYTGKKYCPGGYAWIIPTGDGVANIGLGIRRPYVNSSDMSLSIRDFLNRFIMEHPVASIKLKDSRPISIIGGLVPVGPPLNPRNGGALLVGDAGNFVIASIGAGVPTAVLTGSIAGEASAKYVNGEADLSEYERIIEMELREVLVNGYRIRGVIDVLCRSDIFMEHGLKLFGREHFTDLIRVKLPTSIKFLRWIERLARTL